MKSLLAFMLAICMSSSVYAEDLIKGAILKSNYEFLILENTVSTSLILPGPMYVEVYINTSPDRRAIRIDTELELREIKYGTNVVTVKDKHQEHSISVRANDATIVVKAPKSSVTIYFVLRPLCCDNYCWDKASQDDILKVFTLVKNGTVVEIK